MYNLSRQFRRIRMTYGRCARLFVKTNEGVFVMTNEGVFEHVRGSGLIVGPFCGQT